MFASGALGSPGDVIDVAEGMGDQGLRVGSLIVPIAEDIAEKSPNMIFMCG
jgi:hypothetical protein